MLCRHCKVPIPKNKLYFFQTDYYYYDVAMDMYNGNFMFNRCDKVPKDYKLTFCQRCVIYFSQEHDVKWATVNKTESQQQLLKLIDYAIEDRQYQDTNGCDWIKKINISEVIRLSKDPSSQMSF